MANLFYDQKVVRELLTFAADLEAEVQRLEREAADRRDHAA